MMPSVDALGTVDEPRRRLLEEAAGNDRARCRFPADPEAAVSRDLAVAMPERLQAPAHGAATARFFLPFGPAFRRTQFDWAFAW